MAKQFAKMPIYGIKWLIMSISDHHAARLSSTYVLIAYLGLIVNCNVSLVWNPLDVDIKLIGDSMT